MFRSVGMLAFAFLTFAITPQDLVADDSLDDLNRYLLAGGTWKSQGEESAVHRYAEGAGTRYIIRYGAPNSISVVGRHPKTNVMTWWLFRDTGEVFVTEISGARQSDDTLKLNYKSANGGRGELALKMLSENRIESSGRGEIVGQSVTGDSVWEAQETPSDIEWLEADDGAEEITDKLLFRGTRGFRSIRGVSENGETFYGTSLGRWILGGKFFMYIGNGVGEGGQQLSHLVVSGKNPETGEVTAWEFDSSGAYDTFTLNEGGDEITGSGYKGDGRSVEFRGKLTQRDDVLLYEATQSIDGGERLPYEWSYHPVPKNLGGVKVGARFIPTPTTVSPKLASFIETSGSMTDYEIPSSAAGWLKLREKQDNQFERLADNAAQSFDIAIKAAKIGGVNCYWLTPTSIPDENTDRLLVHIHGGAYVFSAGRSGTWEGLHIANACRCKVLSIDYRLPPEFPFPAAIEDVVAVWKQLHLEYSNGKVGLFGTSSGGGLALAIAKQLRDLKLRQPAALYLGTPWSDLTKTGDSYFTNADIDAVLMQYEGLLAATAKLYAGSAALSHPLVSPINGDFSGLPPTILLCGTRDLFLSNTVRTHRKLRKAGIRADLHVFEGQSHGMYLLANESPESAEAFAEVALFFDEHLSAN